MKVASLRMFPLEIPFQMSFKHAGAERNRTSAVLVECRTMDEHTGMGEGCPRSYVTGESVGGCLKFFERHHTELKQSIHTLDDLKSWVRKRQKEIDENPAAWCALELSLLEALAKDSECSVEKLLNLPELEGKFIYTAVLGSSSPEIFAGQMVRYAKLGFTDYKVKVSLDPVLDRTNLDKLNSLPGPVRIRLDANNLWTQPEKVLKYLNGIEIAPFAIEEPLKAMDYTGLQMIAEQTGISIILDESFLREEHFEAAGTLKGRYIINLRVSKMGGLLRSLSIAQEATNRGVPLIIGSQVGETSILTRAALTVANALRPETPVMEGAFGTLLLKSDVVSKPLMFGKGGALKIAEMLNPSLCGFGLQYSLKKDGSPANDGQLSYFFRRT